MSISLSEVEQWLDLNYQQYLDSMQFTELAGKLRDDVIEVLKFFCNEELVKSGLADFANQYYTFVQKGNAKSLRAFFDIWGAKNHFNQATENTPSDTRYQISKDFVFPKATPTLYGELKPALFLDVLLKNGYLSSDPGAGTVHGKWSHSIQLFLLEEARKKGILKLHHTNVREFMVTISQNKTGGDANNLWMLLFDSFEDQIFTCPNNIRNALASMKEGEAQLFVSEKLSKHKVKVEKYNHANGVGAYSKHKYLDKSKTFIKQETSKLSGLLWFDKRAQDLKSDRKSQVKNTSNTTSSVFI
jgi:hypothetical protein